jgi:hypothetical protein
MDPLEDLFDCLNHSFIERFGRYFDLITFIHSVFPIDRFHKFLPSNALTKRCRYFIPHPPKYFGISKEDHFTKWNPPEELFPTHKKRLLILAQGQAHGSTLQQRTKKTLTTDPFSNTCEADEVSLEVEAGVVAGLKCLQP